MTQQEFDRGDELVDSVIQKLRAQSIPVFANPQVDFPVTNRSGRHKQSTSSPENQLGAKPFSRAKLVLAASIGVVILVSSFSLFPWQSSSQRAFAEMQQAIREIRSVGFEMRAFAGEELTGKFHITVLQSGDVRMESAVAAHALNVSRAEYMVVDDTNQTVRIEPVYDVAGMRQKLTGVFETLLHLDPLPTTKMRTIDFRGKRVREFKTIWDGSAATAMVDMETNLPIEIQLDRGRGPDGQLVREVVSNFQFNTEVQESRFAIVPPAGYALTRVERRDPVRSSRDLTLTAGKGLGPVRFGMSLREVKEQLGDPDMLESQPLMVAEQDQEGQLIFPMRMVPANPPQKMHRLQYRSLGVQFDVSAANGVEWIRCYAKQMSWGQFEGATSAGIRIGMSKEQVKALLDPEVLERATWKQEDDRWLSNGVDFVFRADTLVELSAGASNFLEK